jgi:aldose 1-epimerase
MSTNLTEGQTKPTPVNLANHSYFCLGGHSSQNGILDHLLQIEADSYTPNNAESIPTKDVVSLDDHEFMKFGPEPANLKERLENLAKS